MKPSQLREICDKAAESLGEHFDAVQIMATWTEGGVTRALKIGRGSWYARQGMAHEFINEDIAQENAAQIVKAIKRRDDEL